jgi:aminoglycoside phosphotransferase (APT) family kinase protein
MGELPDGLSEWVAEVTGGVVTAAKQIPAGGRSGWFVDVQDAAGENLELFLQAGREGADAAIESFHGFDVEAQVMIALREIDVRVPRVWAHDETRRALLVDRAPGRVWFQPPRDLDEQVSVAQDYVRQLARWHKTPADRMNLAGVLGPVKSWKEHQRDSLEVADSMVAKADDVDPLITFTLDWLRENIPDAEGPVVVLQGDTGPGNFLYEAGAVTAVLDWELAHLGDPMDDIAWLSWRATQHGFPDFPQRLREYEQLSGVTVDPARVNYYRVNAFARLGPYFGLADMGLKRPTLPTDVAADTDRAADGSFVIMSLLHRRMRLEATSAALGWPVPPREVEEAPPKGYERMYDRVLDQVKTMVERTEDRASISLGKAVARQVKHLKELDRNGTLFESWERDRIGELLGTPIDDVHDGRRTLVQAVRDGRVAMDAYVDYQWHRLRRDDHLMRHASGALYERSWPELR